jgi:hypothetical protein
MEQINEQELVNTEKPKKEFFTISLIEPPKTEPTSAKTLTHSTPSEFVEKIFNEAVVSTVTNDDTVKSEIIESAKDAIYNKTKAIKDEMETEAKKAHFDNNKGACECFGFTEKSTEKWAVTMMSFWYRIMTAIWIVIGFFTYAPITFIAHKLSVIIKKTWIAVVVSGIIYAIIATSPLWISLLTKMGA